MDLELNETAVEAAAVAPEASMPPAVPAASEALDAEPTPGQTGTGGEDAPWAERAPSRIWRLLAHGRAGLTTFISILLAFAIGLGSGYFAWGHQATAAAPIASPAAAQPSEHPHAATIDVSMLNQQVNPPEGLALAAKFGDLGPRLLAAGAIDYGRFAKVYEDAGQPLSDEQTAILRQGSDRPIVITRENAYFLLNFFWAVGLTNRNVVLLIGPMMKDGKEGVGNFASTGGWTLGARSPVDLYASSNLISLTLEQQDRLQGVAEKVFRPCCNNPTHFPDCNHGMAMLGLLEAMASQDATADEMFKAAKSANAFWYPQQMLELAIAFKVARGVDFTDVDARELTSAQFSSGAGFEAVHQALADNGLLPGGTGGGNSCGV